MKNFKVGDIVEIINTNSALDRTQCEILGYYSRYHNVEFCIVGFENAIAHPSFDQRIKALVITEHCLQRG